MGMTAFNDVRFALLGGSIVDANALLRSYIWHCVGIPVVAAVPYGSPLLAREEGWRNFRTFPVVLEREVKEPRKY